MSVVRIPLADFISVVRAGLVLVVLAYSLQEKWEQALFSLVIAWSTDPVDGWVARRHGSLRDKYPGLDMDGLADTVLAFGSSLVVVIYGWYYYRWDVAWLLVGLYIATVVSGIGMALVINRPTIGPTRWLIAINMIVLHGLIQIGGTIAWFAYMAYGRYGSALVVEIAVLVAWLQRHKIKLWLSGKLA